MKFNITAKKVLLSFVMATTLLSVGWSAAAPLPVLAAAQNCPGGTGGNAGGVSKGLTDLGNKSEDITCANINISDKRSVAGVVAKIIDWALYISGAIAVIYVIYGGYRYLMSGGNEETATKARQTVYNALIGLIIIVLAYVIVNAVANLITSP
jgi:type IV secretion system pilin